MRLAEVQRSVATAIIEGLITAAALTLFVLAVIALLVLNRDKDDRGWREKWWDRLDRNVTLEETPRIKRNRMTGHHGKCSCW